MDGDGDGDGDAMGAIDVVSAFESISMAAAQPASGAAAAGGGALASTTKRAIVADEVVERSTAKRARVAASSVVTVRGLPLDASDEEVAALARPFGLAKLFVRSGVGQAFVQLQSSVSAAAMIDHYAGAGCVLRGHAVAVDADVAGPGALPAGGGGALPSAGAPRSSGGGGVGPPVGAVAAGGGGGDDRESPPTPAPAAAAPAGGAPSPSPSPLLRGECSSPASAGDGGMHNRMGGDGGMHNRMGGGGGGGGGSPSGKRAPSRVLHVIVYARAPICIARMPRAPAGRTRTPCARRLCESRVRGRARWTRAHPHALAQVPHVAARERGRDDGDIRAIRRPPAPDRVRARPPCAFACAFTRLLPSFLRVRVGSTRALITGRARRYKRDSTWQALVQFSSAEAAAAARAGTDGRQM